MTIRTPKNVDTLESARLYYNENFSTLISNFNSATPPTSSDYVLLGVNTAPPVGTLWYDSSNSVVKVQTSLGTWKQAYIPLVSSPLGTNFSEGELVYDTDSNTLKLRDNTTTLKTLLAQGVSINNTQIGSATPSSGSFTTLSSSSTASFKSVQETSANLSSSSGHISVDLSLGSVFTVSLTENTTLNTANITPASVSGYSTESFVLKVTQDTSPRTFTWDGVVWPAGQTPTLSTGSGEVDVFVLSTFDAGTTWYGFVAGQNMS